MKILVLFGGSSAEREISIRSAKSVASALKVAGHQVVEFDAANDLDQVKDSFDIVFPILHGTGAEDGEIQKEMDSRCWKYLGSNVEACRISFDKVQLKQIMLQSGILTPGYELVTQESFANSVLAAKPFVLKPTNEGSSVDTYIVNDPASFSEDLNDVFERHPEMLLEELISGVEVTVPILEDKALPVVEIVPPDGGVFDYENKYNGKTKELCPPENVSEELQVKAQETALNLHQKIGARHLSRTDMIINDGGEIYVLELNTLPGMTSQSIYPKSAAYAGMSMSELINVFVDLVSR
jgi:D-alanine-D-alanine ligase